MLPRSERRKRKGVEGGGLRVLRFRIHTDFGPALAALKLDHTGNPCEEGVIAPKADIEPRKKFGAPLADDDTARLDQLTAEALDAESLAL